MRRRILLVSGWLLPFVLAGLFFAKGRRYNSEFFGPPAAESSALPVPATLGGWVLEGAKMLSAERMFEKIDGKSDYYLQYGATGLCSGEWVANGQRWDMYLYRFAEGRGARGAYVGERPVDGLAVEGVEGYTVPGQTVIVAGAFYLQLNAQTEAADTGAVLELALALAPLLAGTNTESQAERGIDLARLAADAGAGETEQFLPENAFGFSVLDKVRSIRVSLDGAEAVWFTAPGDAETIAAFAKELAIYGGENLFSQGQGTGGSMFGSWEFAGLLGGAVWGIHNAPSRETLLQHWKALGERVRTLSETP